jgi:hypothetical protein
MCSRRMRKNLALERIGANENTSVNPITPPLEDVHRTASICCTAVVLAVHRPLASKWSSARPACGPCSDASTSASATSTATAHGPGSASAAARSNPLTWPRNCPKKWVSSSSSPNSSSKMAGSKPSSSPRGRTSLSQYARTTAASRCSSADGTNVAAGPAEPPAASAVSAAGTGAGTGARALRMRKAANHKRCKSDARRSEGWPRRPSARSKYAAHAELASNASSSATAGAFTVTTSATSAPTERQNGKDSVGCAGGAVAPTAAGKLSKRRVKQPLSSLRDTSCCRHAAASSRTAGSRRQAQQTWGASVLKFGLRKEARTKVSAQT